jgi:hypothetical protein
MALSGRVENLGVFLILPPVGLSWGNESSVWRVSGLQMPCLFNVLDGKTNKLVEITRLDLLYLYHIIIRIISNPRFAS